MAAAPELFWLSLVIIFSALEGVTAALVSVWFVAGALAALLTALAGAGIQLQMLVFALVSLLALCAVRPICSRLLTPNGMTPTNADRLIGKEGVVLEAIDNLAAQGQVKVAGQQWSARSATGEAIPAGSTVTVMRIEGVRLFVQPAEEPQEDTP